MVQIVAYPVGLLLTCISHFLSPMRKRVKGNEVSIQPIGCLLSLLKALSEKKRDLEPYEEWLENIAGWVWKEKSGKVMGSWQWGWELGTG